MGTQLELVITPESAQDEAELRHAAAAHLAIAPSEISAILPLRRSIDARQGRPMYRILVEVFVGEPPPPPPPRVSYPAVDGRRRVLVVGSGPAGLFAALRLVELGLKPVVLERGKDVQSRRRDLRAILQHGIVDPDSNYCFGEGGAGTYSDGKLYTRSTKRGDVRRILSLLCQHGAPDEILIDAHPHLGSNRLPGIIRAMRETLLGSGAELHFGARVTDLLLAGRRLQGVVVNDDEEQLGEALILAAGHSARDIFYLLHRRGIALEPKPFAMGVRIEHSQSLIDEIQYHSHQRGPFLPAASYRLACQVEGRGVFSFCMCPGGMIIPAATAPGELVLNGMSISRRDSPFANAGLVVGVEEEDWQGQRSHGVLAALELQRALEQAAYLSGGEAQRAPAQRATDFVLGKSSSTLGDCSYLPGVTPAPLHEILPRSIASRLHQGLLIFGRRMHGFYSAEALLLGVESRTSSPVRIPRHAATLMHVEIDGLFPCGEGAGYAGGIVSSAIDGERCAAAVARYLA